MAHSQESECSPWKQTLTCDKGWFSRRGAVRTKVCSKMLTWCIALVFRYSQVCISQTPSSISDLVVKC